MIDSIIVGASSLLFATQNYLGGGAERAQSDIRKVPEGT